jgi:hypothetical protein
MITSADIPWHLGEYRRFEETHCPIPSSAQIWEHFVHPKR